jgi:hypothetical protein
MCCRYLQERKSLTICTCGQMSESIMPERHAASCAHISMRPHLYSMHLGTPDRIPEVADLEVVQFLWCNNEYVTHSDLGLLFGVQSSAALKFVLYSSIIQAGLVDCSHASLSSLLFNFNQSCWATGCFVN